MAYLAANDKILDPNQQQQQAGQSQPGQMPQVGGATSGVVSGASGGNVSTAGVGAGGTGGWTNIQAYLNANKNNAASSKLLSDTVGGQFDKEQKSYQDQANSVKSQAKDSVDKSNMNQTQAAQLLDQASRNYSYAPDANKVPQAPSSAGGKGYFTDQPQTPVLQKATQAASPTDSQNQAYLDSTGQLRNALNAQYAGPQNFNYGLSSATQNYGSELGGDDQFRNLMSNLYQQGAGRSLSSGEKTLQNQIDINNDSLNQARQNLLSKYAGLKTDLDNTLTNTNDALNAYSKQFLTNQSALKSYLTGQQDTAANDRLNAEAAARSGYQNDYANDPAMTWTDGTKNSAKFIEDYLNSRSPYITSPNWWESAGGEQNQIYRGMKDALDNFYTNESGKYAGVGDKEKRKWNALADIFGQDTRLGEGNDIVKRGRW